MPLVSLHGVQPTTTAPLSRTTVALMRKHHTRFMGRTCACQPAPISCTHAHTCALLVTFRLVHCSPSPATPEMRFLTYIEVLEQAAPGQDPPVMSLTDAWKVYLRQRAVIWLDAVLVFHVFTLDEVKLDEGKGGHRRNVEEYVSSGILKEGKSGCSAGLETRTDGLAQAIAQAVCCKDILWRTHSYGSQTYLAQKYLAFCWPALDNSRNIGSTGCGTDGIRCISGGGG